MRWNPVATQLGPSMASCASIKVFSHRLKRFLSGTYVLWMKETNLTGDKLSGRLQQDLESFTPKDQCLSCMVAPMIGLGGLSLYPGLLDFSGD